MTAKFKNRRGVTLLFVISMIVLFLLMGTTFVVVSNDFMRAAQLRTRVTVNDINSLGEFNGQRFVQQAMYDLVRGPDLDNNNSPLRGHSILGDMYGYGFTAHVQSIEDDLIQAPDAAADAAPQFARIELIGMDGTGGFDTSVVGNSILSQRPVKTTLRSGDVAANFDVLPTTQGRFNGQLLTFVSGGAAGITARIIDHQVFTVIDSAFLNGVRYDHRFVIMLLNPTSTVRPGNLDDAVVTRTEDANNSDRVVINGRPFAGTGAGVFNPLAAILTPALDYPDDEVNQVMNSRQAMWQATMASNTPALGMRENDYAVNENYDAADRQNMFLAGDGIFSFHNRNGLIDPFVPVHVPVPPPSMNLGTTESTCTATSPFASSPVMFDNDGDGNDDSVFMDIGLSSFTSVDGRLLKPMVAYHVIDLDSKININTHGNRAQVSTNGRLYRTALTLDPAVATNFMAPGEGFGPSEILLNQVFPATIDGFRTEADRLIIGDILSDGTLNIAGRFGTDADNDRRLEAGGGPSPGRGEIARDPFSAYKHFGLPFSESVDPANTPGIIVGRSYGTRPMDIYGRMFTGFPAVPAGYTRSMPIVDIDETNFTHNEVINNPYETNFGFGDNSEKRFDQLYTLEELERIYRQNELTDFIGTSDGFGRFGRLAELAPSMRGMNRLAFTTDSFEVPTLIQQVVEDNFETIAGKLYQVLRNDDVSQTQFGIPLDTTLGAQGYILREQEILANIAGLRQNGVGSFTIDAVNRSMLPTDVRMGRPFNINQPFGDGLDNDTDGTVDEFGELDTSLIHPNGNAVNGFDYNNDGVVSADGTVDAPYLGRQQFARQLYVLTLLATELVDRDNDGDFTEIAADFFEFNDDGGGMPPDVEDRRDYRRAIAQWAINVVDFRDSDSIMTPFEFDVDPFNGWDADGDLTTGGANIEVVWGVERPDLLITETFNMHDRRTQDTMDDPSGLDTAGGDPHIDSRMVPVDSTFIELYNPWVVDSGVTPQTTNARELDTVNGGTGIDLAQVTPGSSDPVWRIAVVAGTGDIWSANEFEPFDDADEVYSAANMNIFRYVYFTEPNPVALTSETIDQETVFAPIISGLSSTTVRPGQHAVLGSRGVNVSGTYTTFIARRTGATDSFPAAPTAMDLQTDMTRRIELDPTNSRINVVDSANVDSFSNNVVVFPIEGPISSAGPRRSFGISSPVSQYSDAIYDPGNTDAALDVIEGPDGPYFVRQDSGERVTIDVPANLQSEATSEFSRAFLQEDGLYDSVYVILLQRLADPTRPFNAMTNPYRTIDSAGSDLFVYNGLEDDTAMLSGDPEEIYFGTYERRTNLSNDLFSQNDMMDINPGAGRFRMLWKTEYTGVNPTGDSLPEPGAAGTYSFTSQFTHSLGRTNDGYDTANGGNGSPFAWLTWNNRPFSSPYELSLVPFTSSYFLTNRFDISMIDSNSTAMNDVYDFTGPIDVALAEPRAYRHNYLSGEFPHLLNFHADGTVDASDDPLFLHRLFDYVEVPSPYSGTETYLNPTAFWNNATTNAAGANTQMTRGFAPPFDYVSNYRYPGKINVNTITDNRVWNAIMGNYALNGSVTFNNWRATVGMPGMVTNPLRAHGALNYVSGNVPNPADAGLFRRENGGGDPLLDYDPTTDPLDHTSRSAYFRYHMRNRLGNLVTNRSSVFAIWVTVGYFEIETEQQLDVSTGSMVFSNVIGEEYIDPETGQEIYNRGFFIVDRSIPVAFEPGKNHNVDRAIRVSSFIE